MNNENNTIENEEVEKEVVTTASGKQLVIPKFDPEHVTLKFRRRTRHLKGDAAMEEIFWLMLEEFLTEEELAVWDEITEDELTTILENSSLGQENLKK